MRYIERTHKEIGIIILESGGAGIKEIFYYNGILTVLSMYVYET